MKYPTAEQIDGAAARRIALDFGLTDRALQFARLYAAHPRLGATKCALRAGYARRCARGAHVRASELLRDRRVISAIMYFGARALNDARAEARRQLACLAVKEGRLWSGWDRKSFERLAATLNRLDTHAERLEKIYIRDQDFSL